MCVTSLTIISLKKRIVLTQLCLTSFTVIPSVSRSTRTHVAIDLVSAGTAILTRIRPAIVDI